MQQQKRKPGRPARRSEGAALDRIYLRATQAERESFMSAATRSGMSLSAWLRAAAQERLEREEET